MRIHFHYEALDSREQRVARLWDQISRPFTMAGLCGQPDFEPTICTYCAYFSRPETDLFSCNYEAVLDPYWVDPMNTAATLTPARVSQQIYTASQQRDPTAFLLWHATHGLVEDLEPSRISLRHSVSNYASQMGRPPCRWDEENFANHGEVSYGTAPLANWYTTYLHLSPAVHVLSAASMDTSLAGDTNLTLLGPYGEGDAGVETIRCCKTVCVPAPYVGLLLVADLTPIEAWHCLRGAIVNAAVEEACWTLIDWLRAALVRAGSENYSALMVNYPSAPLPNAILLQHRHRVLLSHLPRLELNINRTEGTRIAETVVEVAVELYDLPTSLRQ